MKIISINYKFLKNVEGKIDIAEGKNSFEVEKQK